MTGIFQAGKHRLPFGTHTYVMGILNVTPDSFSDGGKWLEPEKAVAHALEMEEQEILQEFEAAGMTITYLTDKEQTAFDEAIAPFKAEMVEYFGADACEAFHITG